MQATKDNNSTNHLTILLGEDDLEVRNYLEMALRCQGHRVESAQDGDEVLTLLQDSGGTFAAVLLDIVMPRLDGLETLKEIRRINREVPVIMVSGASSPLNVVEAMKNGANDFLAKPVSHEDLRKVLKNVLAPKPAAPADAPPAHAAAAPKGLFYGTNAYMRELQAIVPQVGWSEASVLIQGETGSGKEVLARDLHAHSPRSKKPFLKLNCAALPSELVESELFGYERGAFTGAFQKKPGMFELADGGTLLLDEIGDMDFKLQAKLLQVLQDQEFHRLGGKDPIKVNVRVLAATHRDLEKAILEEKFREDLYYRLNVINLRVPPLRERKEDIIGITEFLMKKHGAPGAVLPVISAALRQALLSHDWPGNIRELENCVRKFLVLRDADKLAADLQLQRKSPARAASNLDMAEAGETETEATILEQVTKAKQNAERTAIIAALRSTNWNRKKAALLLRIDYKALLYKMKKLSIEDKMAALPNSTDPGAPEGDDPAISAAR